MRLLLLLVCLPVFAQANKPLGLADSQHVQFDLLE